MIFSLQVYAVDRQNLIAPCLVLVLWLGSIASGIVGIPSNEPQPEVMSGSRTVWRYEVESGCRRPARRVRHGRDLALGLRYVSPQFAMFLRD